jgi:hypothetical protein
LSVPYDNGTNVKLIPYPEQRKREPMVEMYVDDGSPLIIGLSSVKRIHFHRGHDEKQYSLYQKLEGVYTNSKTKYQSEYHWM